MTEDRNKRPRPRVDVRMPRELLARIDDYRFEHRLNRREAITQILELSLEASREKGTADSQSVERPADNLSGRMPL
jgi:metal-responsive CopG/Arc/MetJ family transcriptional regulator